LDGSEWNNPVHVDDQPDDSGFAEAMAWIGQRAPSPRIVIAMEGTRSYGIGLAHASHLAALQAV
jgi:hypothetical protein